MKTRKLTPCPVIYQQPSNASNLKQCMMNRRAAVVFLVFFIPVVYILYIASSLIALIFEDGLRDSVALSTVEANSNRTDATHPIPKIIHQTWKNNNIPEQWQIAQYTWYLSHSFPRSSLTCRSLDMHPDYHYMVRVAFNLPSF